MKLSTTLHLTIIDSSIKHTTVLINDWLECRLCHRLFQKGEPLIQAIEENGHRHVFLCPNHLKKEESL